MICRNCGAGLEADRIDTALGVVTCSHCGSLHKISDDAVGASSGGKASTPAEKSERLDVSLPSRFKVKRGAGGMEVTWSAGGIFPGLVLAIIGGAFAYVALTSGMLFLLIASVGIFYFAATRAFNEHRIRVDGARLEVTQGPLPLPGTRRLDTSDIVQLYATEHISRTEKRDGGNHGVSIRKHYQLSANTQSSGRVKILGGLGDPLHALWLEQEIEGVLGIVDTHVSGEHVR